jgi:hypothetical protein
MSLRGRFPICPICNEPVEINTAKTDENGKAVHEDCYLKAIKEKIAADRRGPDFKTAHPNAS